MYMNVKCPMDTDLQLLAVLPRFWIVPDQSRRFIRGPISHQVRHVITPALLHNTCLQLSQHVHATYLEFQSFLYGNSMYSGTGNLVQIPAPLDGFLTSSPIYTNPMVLVYSSKWEMKTYDKLDILLETALWLPVKTWDSLGMLWANHNEHSTNPKHKYILYSLLELHGCTSISLYLTCPLFPTLPEQPSHLLVLCEVSQKSVASVSALLVNRAIAKSIMSGIRSPEFKLHSTT